VFREKGGYCACQPRIRSDIASRVIEKMRVDEEAFYRDILVAERGCVKMKKFWE
jgi:ATP-dependent helicase Lhr and Lhr-like helicase